MSCRRYRERCGYKDDSRAYREDDYYWDDDKYDYRDDDNYDYTYDYGDDEDYKHVLRKDSEEDRKNDCKRHPRPPHKPRPDTQTHVHEFLGSDMIAGRIPHNHRFAGVTSQEIPYGRSHIHSILTNNDFFVNHYHEVGVKTGPAIYVGNGKHVHFVNGKTTSNFGHHHHFGFTTLIENPLEKDKKY